MPYKGKDLSMVIILPDEIEDDSTGLEKVGYMHTCSKKTYVNVGETD